MSRSVAVFAAFGLVSQLVLVGFFSARRWLPRLARPLGYAAYGFGSLGLFVGGWLIAVGASWRLFVGPLLMFAWAVFGAWIDVVRPIEWRRPIRPSVFAPYVAVYFLAQMFLWWPLRDGQRLWWGVFAVLFAANTALNIRGHFGTPTGPEVPA